MNGAPFLIADVYLDAELAKRLPKNALTSKTALRLGASLPGVKIVDARQTLTIGMADLETAKLLELPLNAAIAHVNRSAVDQHGRLVLIALGVYRSDVVRSISNSNDAASGRDQRPLNSRAQRRLYAA